MSRLISTGKGMAFICGTFVLITGTVPVFADQAAWVSRSEAVSALEILAKYERIRHYCAPCGDKEATEEAIESIGLFKAKDGSFWEIRVNGKGVDLAYVYFEKKKGKWINAALEARIDVSDVPKELSAALPATAH